MGRDLAAPHARLPARPRLAAVGAKLSADVGRADRPPAAAAGGGGARGGRGGGRGGRRGGRRVTRVLRVPGARADGGGGRRADLLTRLPTPALAAPRIRRLPRRAGLDVGRRTSSYARARRSAERREVPAR